MTAPTLFDVQQIPKHCQHRVTLERELALNAATKPRAAMLATTAITWQARAVHAAVVQLIVVAPPADRAGMVLDANAALLPFGLAIAACPNRSGAGVHYEVVDIKTGEIL